MQCARSAAAHFGFSFIWTLSFAAQLDHELRELPRIFMEQ
jgi:hypothetical protein